MGELTVYLAREMPTVGGSTDPADFDTTAGIFDGNAPYLLPALEYLSPSAMDIDGAEVTAKIKKTAAPVKVIGAKIRALGWTKYLSEADWEIDPNGEFSVLYQEAGIYCQTEYENQFAYGFQWKSLPDAGFAGKRPTQMKIKIQDVTNVSLMPASTTVIIWHGSLNPYAGNPVGYATVQNLIDGSPFMVVFPDGISGIVGIGIGANPYFNFDYDSGPNPSFLISDISFDK